MGTLLHYSKSMAVLGPDYDPHLRFWSLLMGRGLSEECTPEQTGMAIRFKGPSSRLWKLGARPLAEEEHSREAGGGQGGTGGKTFLEAHLENPCL